MNHKELIEIATLRGQADARNAIIKNLEAEIIALRALQSAAFQALGDHLKDRTARHTRPGGRDEAATYRDAWLHMERARNAALEEAAKVAESRLGGWAIGVAIRALISKE